MSLSLKFYVSLFCLIVAYGCIIGSQNSLDNINFDNYLNIVTAIESARSNQNQSFEIVLPFDLALSNKDAEICVRRQINEYNREQNCSQKFSVYVSPCNGNLNQRIIGIKCNEQIADETY